MWNCGLPRPCFTRSSKGAATAITEIPPNPGGIIGMTMAITAEPVVAGGVDSVESVVPACRSCNRRKG